LEYSHQVGKEYIGELMEENLQCEVGEVTAKFAKRIAKLDTKITKIEQQIEQIESET